jgi:hypothetical protein
MATMAPRPFPVRFLGRPYFWMLLLVSASICGGMFYYWRSQWVTPRRSLPLHESNWFLYSGLFLLLLFLAGYVFSLRKWSIKLPFFRRLGSNSRADMDGLWSGLQQLNRRIVSGRMTDRKDIEEQANQILRQTFTSGIRRIVVEDKDFGKGQVYPHVTARPREPFGRLEIWLEVHSSLGAVGCVGSLLHADLSLHSPIGWGLVLLSMVVLVTGLLGLWMYRFGPPMLAKVAFGLPYEEAAIATQDLQRCLDAILAKVDSEHLRSQLLGLIKGSSSKLHGDQLRRFFEAHEEDNQALGRDVLVLAGIRERLSAAAAPSRRVDLLMRSWRWVHVPAAVLLLALIVVHILIVAIY